MDRAKNFFLVLRQKPMNFNLQMIKRFGELEIFYRLRQKSNTRDYEHEI